jgi:hypothetical protein
VACRGARAGESTPPHLVSAPSAKIYAAGRWMMRARGAMFYRARENETMKLMQFLNVHLSACLAGIPCIALAGDGEHDNPTTDSAENGEHDNRTADSATSLAKLTMDSEEERFNERRVSEEEAFDERRLILQTYAYPQMEVGGYTYPIDSCAQLYGETRCDDIARATIANNFCLLQGGVGWQSFQPDCSDWPFYPKVRYFEWIWDGQIQQRWLQTWSSCKFRKVVCWHDVP